MDWLEPMAATRTDERFDDPGWLFEQKLDGFRYLAFVSGDEAKLLTRNRIRHRHPDVEATLVAQPGTNFVVDGEMVSGRYAVFDVLRFDGHDVTTLPLDARKKLLRGPLHVEGAVGAGRTAEGGGLAAYERACREGWEGVMAKRRDSVYEHKRSRAWLKMKCDASQEFVVGGFTDPRGARNGFGALLVGYYDGDDLRLRGQARHRVRHPVTARPVRATPGYGDRLNRPFTAGTGFPKKDAHWVRPEIVVDAAFMEWTGEGKLRHPRFVRVRDDKSPRDVVRES